MEDAGKRVGLVDLGRRDINLQDEAQEAGHVSEEARTVAATELARELVGFWAGEDADASYDARIGESLQQITKTVAAMHRDQEDINELKAETRAILRKIRAA